jgi:lipid-binding SYLF domain-containing protein
MTISIRCITAIALVTLLGFAACSKPETKEVKLDLGSVQGEAGDSEKVGNTINDFLAAEEVVAFFEDSYGFAVFPTIGKGGMGIGGAYGKGWVFKGHKSTGITRMTQVTIGFQLGGQTFSQLIFFQDQRAYDNFTSGNFEFGAQATAVAITAGASASASTAGGASAGAGKAQAKTDYTGGMAVFTRAKGGLMYEATLGGQKFSFSAYE